MKKKGISLVALVVTIIVLIILTGAVIATFMEGGIIDKAKQAVMLSDYTTLVEAYNVAYNTAKIDEVTGTGEKVNKIEILEKVVNELGLKGFSFPENEVKYEGDNDKIADWVKSEFELSALTDLGYIFSTIDGVTYMTGLSGEDDENFFGKVAEIKAAGFTVEDGELYGNDGHVEEGFIATSDKVLKDGKVIATVLIKGDVDGACLIDGEDRQIITEIAVGTLNATEIELLAADINNDGLVNQGDIDLCLDIFGDMSAINKYQKVKVSKIPTVVSE